MAKKDKTQKKDRVREEQPGPIADFLEASRKELDLAVEAERENRTEAVDCLNFALGGAAQWDNAEVQRRKRRKRIMLTLNQCPKFIKKLTGQMRQNRATIKVHAADTAATRELALVRQGLINNILYESDFETIQDDAAKQLVTCGYGAWRVATRYDEQNPFVQEIYVDYLENPLLVFMDPRSKDFFYRDAEYGFVLSKMSKEDFESKYPNTLMPSEDLGNATAPGGAYEHWYDTNGAVTIAEKYAIVRKKKTLCLMETGEVLLEEDANELVRDWKRKYGLLAREAEFLAAEGTPGAAALMPGPASSPPSAAPQLPPGPPGPPGMPPGPPGGMPMGPPRLPPVTAPPEPKITDKKSWEVSEIRFWKLTGHSILEGGLEGTLIPGRFLPVVLVRGEKINVEGRTFIKGLVNDARDAQRLLNWWETNAAEHVALAPKAPWVVTAEQIKGYEKYFSQANEENYPYLVYNPDPEAPGVKPTREGMGNTPVAVFSQIQRAEAHVKSSFGMSGADLGEMDQLSGRASGVALGARQKPTDDNTYLFEDNLNKATMHTGRIIESMLGTIYDTERDVRLRSHDGTASYMPINTTIRAAITKAMATPGRYEGLRIPELRRLGVQHGGEYIYNDMSKGKYETVIKTGPNYATQKAESADILMKLTNSNPKQMGLLLDLIVKNIDFLDAEEAAERLEKTLPPGMIKPKEGKPPEPPMPPPPQAVVAMKKVEVEQAKIRIQLEKLKVEQARLQTEKMKALKALQGEKGEVKRVVLDLLKELFAETEQPLGQGAGKGPIPMPSPEGNTMEGGPF